MAHRRAGRHARCCGIPARWRSGAARAAAGRRSTVARSTRLLQCVWVEGACAFPVHSFPELSLEAWLYKDAKILTDDELAAAESADGNEDVIIVSPIQTYTVANIIDDGCFIERA